MLLLVVDLTRSNFLLMSVLLSVFIEIKVLYQRIDKFSMRSSPVSLLANVIIAELEQKNMKKSINSERRMFCSCEVGDTLIQR